jgi:hypothetical protein
VQVFDSDFATDSVRRVGDFGGQLYFMPFDGFKAVGDGTLIDTGGESSFKLGSLQVGGGGHGALAGDAGLCLGSAQASTGCANRLAYASFDAPIDFGVQIGDPQQMTSGVDIPTNLATAVGNRSLSVTGDIGGTVKVGSVEIGRVIPINFQIPRASSLMSTSTSRQTADVRDSFLAVPRKAASDNATASTGRHAARDAVNSAVADVKAAVNKTLNSKPKHAKPDTED